MSNGSHPSNARLPAAGATGRAASIKAWQQRASPLTRYALLAYVLLLVDATLYPWSGWRDRGIGPFEYLLEPWPTYFTGFDVLVNVLGYVPLGLLAGLALYPRLRGWGAVALALLFCLLLSGGLEAVQTFLPSRVPSRLDLLTNGAGALIGSLMAAWLADAILDRGRLRELRLQWFERDASIGLLFLMLWFLALLFPDNFAFAPGGLLKPLFDVLLWSLDLQDRGLLDPGHFFWGEALLAALSLSGAGALMLSLAKPFAPRLFLSIGFVLLSVLVQSLSAGFSSQQNRLFHWLTTGAQTGIVLAMAVLLALSWLPGVWRARVGLLALVGLMVLAGLMPSNPYSATSANWAYGQFLNFHGLTYGLHLVWPFFAALVLWRRARGASQWRPL